MGNATVGAYTLTSVSHIEMNVPLYNVVHAIPGGTALAQAVGLGLGMVTIHGILNPSSECVAVQNIGGLTNSQAYSVSVVIGGVTWVSDTFYIEDTKIETQPGMHSQLPWGKYAITIQDAT